jgi:hypothetical protein
VDQQRIIAGRYALLQEIGRGGMGLVWLAEDRTIGRRVAIKELHLPDGVPVEERAIMEERVLREARAAGRLNDPGVITVYDVLQESGDTYIVMELIQAPTLSAMLRERGPLPPDTVARLAEQLLSALEAAHAAGIVHRDVKPGNIMLLPNGRVKLLDFGIAQAMDDPRLTSSGVLVGSPTYMAPERIRDGQADPGSDLWALGAVLYFAVEGYSPFERSTTAATMNAILNEVPYLTRCQGPLASVITGLLNTVPAARPSPAQVRGLLGQVTTTPPDGTQRISQPIPVPPLARTGRRPLVIALVALLVLGAFAGGWFLGRPGATEAADAVLRPVLTHGQGGDVPEFGMSSGDCAPAPLERGSRFESGASIDCDGPHDFQVLADYDPFQSVDDLSHPGADLDPYAESFCLLVFNSEQVTFADKDAALAVIPLVPTESSWSADGNRNRAIYCVVTRKDGRQLDESVVRDD